MSRMRMWLALALVSGLFSANAESPFPFPVSSGDIKLGEWNVNFRTGKAFAEQYGIPMVLFWANPGCGNCESLERAVGIEEFQVWAEERQLVMLFGYGISNDDNLALKNFARNPSGYYPYVCIYWKKADGTVAVESRFSGLNTGFPVSRDEKGNVLPLHRQFMESVDYLLADYRPVNYGGGTFTCGTSAGTMLEAVVKQTTFVDVPLERTQIKAMEAATATLAVAYPGGERAEQAISWAEGEAEKLVRVAFPKDVVLRAGDRIQLSLLDDAGVSRDVSYISVIAAREAGLSPANPAWVGEEFKFGRLTFDYDAATNAVAQKRAKGESAHTLVLFTGALWCPYCLGMEKSLLSDRKFYDWAESNNVALVEFDQGRASSPATAAGTRAPRLLTYEPDPNLSKTNTVSGAGYLSRHGVERADAERILARTTHYTAKWLAPETTSKRMSQPTFLLIENDEVLGRFAAWRDADRRYDVDENIGRLADFIALTDDDTEKRAYRTVSTHVHTIGGAAESARFQVSDNTVWYAVDGMGAGLITFVETLAPGVTPQLTFALYKDGKLAAPPCQGGLSYTNAADAAEAEFDLSVSAYTEPRYDPAKGTWSVARVSDRLFVDRKLETTAITAGFKSDLILLPEERASSCTSPIVSKKMLLTAGVDYRLSGISADSLQRHFVAKDEANGIYTATSDGVVDISLAEAGGTFVYQVWRPGTVGFAADRIVAREGTDAEVPLVLTRTGGSSGALKVKVSLDLLRSLAVDVARYDWQDGELEWEDGESGDRELVLRLIDDNVFDAIEQSLFFNCAIVSGLGVNTGISTLEAVLQDDDPELPGRLAITSTMPVAAAKTTVVVEEGECLDLIVSRYAGSEGAVHAIARATAGRWESETSLTWAHHDRTADRKLRLRLPALADCPSGLVTVVLASDDIGVDSTRDSVQVRIVRAQAPAFVTDTVTTNLIKGVAFTSLLGVKNVEDASSVLVSRVSGMLPPGVTAAWRAASGLMVLSGVPTKAGTYTCTFQICTVKGGIVLPGDVVRYDISVIDPVAYDETTGQAINPSIEAARTFKSVPMSAQVAKRLAGVVTVTIPTSGRISAKYSCLGGTVPLVATSWAACDDAGVMMADAVSLDGKYVLSVKARPDGAVSLAITDPDFVGDDPMAEIPAVAGMAVSAADWAGQYTVACRLADTEGYEDAMSFGSPVFALKMKSARAVAQGEVTYVGYLPNGRTVSGSTSLLIAEDGTFAQLPLFCYSSTDVFAAGLRIVPGAMAAYEKSGMREPTALRAVTEMATGIPRWTHRNPQTVRGDFAIDYVAYGSCYDPSLDLSSCLAYTSVKTKMKMRVDTPSLPASRVLGTVGEVEEVEVTADGSSLRGTGVSFVASSGFVSGSFVLPFSSGPVDAMYRGVVLPGWTGCGCEEGVVDLPMVLGACWFKDFLSYQEDWQSCTESMAEYIHLPIKRGCAVTFETTAVGVQ